MSDDEAKKTVAKDKNMHKCNLCTLSYASERDLREHFWSLMHHTNIECKKKNSQHNCTLCFTTCGSIAEYRKHLSGEKHKKAAEENRNAEDEKEAAEAREAQHKKSVARVPDKHSNMKDRHTLSDDDDQEQEEQSEGFRRDPIFYKRKKKAQSDKQQTDINQQHSRWDQPDHYHDGDYDRYGNPWDQGYNYRYNNMCHNDYYQNGYHSGYGHPDFQNRYGNGYGWFPPRGGFVGFNGPPRGAVQGPRYVDFDSHENVRMDDDMDMEGESGEEEGVSVHNKEFPSYQGQYWNDYQHNGHPPPPWHGSWNNSSQRGSVGEVEFEQNNEERAVGTKSKKKKKGKWKGKSKTQGERHKGKVNPTNGDSPNAANARKRCRKSDPVKTDPKTSRLGDVNSICAEAKAVMDGFTFQFDKVFSSEHDAETLSHSVRSTSSNKSKSSAKSRSSSSSPSLRLKSLSARKLQNSRVSPKSIRVSPKVNRDSKVVRSELQSEDTNAESGVLEKAEKLCKELREKRQKAKSDKEKIMKSKKNEMRDVLNKQIKTLSDANKSRIKGHLASVEKDSAVSSLQESGIASFSSSQTSADLTASRSSLASSSQTLVSQSEDQTPRNDIERIRHSIENSVRRSLSSPAKPTSSSSESPVNSSKNRKPLSKDSLLKMVNSPRSRNERLHLARMLRTRARTQNKLAPSRLNVQLNGLYDNYEFDEEDIPAISLEDLSPEVKLQIAQLIEDDVNIDLINSEPDTPSSPGIEAKVNLSKPSSISRLEAMEAAAGYGTMANTIQSDAALSIADLNSPPHRPLRESSTDQAVLNVESLETMQFRETSITVTSIDGIPQLQVSEPTVSSNFSPLTLSSPVPTSVPSATSFGDGGQKHMSSAVSSAVDLGRRALQMSGLEDRPSLSHSCTSVAIPSPQSLVPSVNPPQSQYLMSAVLELSLKEEEKQKDIDELERKIDVMRQMLRRTLDHLENSEQRRKELLNDNKKIRERKLKVLRELMGHQSLESPLHTTQLSSPLHAVSENVMTPTRSHLSSESMDIDFVTDCVSSTSQAKPDSNVRIDLPHPDFLSSRLPDQRTEAPSPADTATRPVSMSTVSAPSSSVTKEVDTNLAHSSPSRDKPTSSLSLSCVSVKQEQNSPPPDITPCVTPPSLTETGGGESATVVDSFVPNSSVTKSTLSGTVLLNTQSLLDSFESSSDPTASEAHLVSSFTSGKAGTNVDFSSLTDVAAVIRPTVDSSHTIMNMTNCYHTSTPCAETQTDTDRLASFATWSPLADRLTSVSGSSLRRTHSVDAVTSVSGKNTDTGSTPNIPNLCDSSNSTIRHILASPPVADVCSKSPFDKDAKDSTSSGFVSVASAQRRISESEMSPSKESMSLMSVTSGRTRTVSESSDGDAGKRSQSVPMTYLGSISGGVETAAVLKKLAADLGNLGSLNNMSCVMLDRHDISDKFQSVSSRTRRNSENSQKSSNQVATDFHLMEMDLKGDNSRKASTPRDESDQNGSIASNSSLGEKIRRYCQTVNRRTSLETIEGEASDGDRTLREEDFARPESPGSDNTPGRILKQCSVVLQKLELERQAANGLNENDEVQEMADHDVLVQEVQQLEVMVQDKEQPQAAPIHEATKVDTNGPPSPGRKKRKTKKERDILANRRKYWFDSSSDNNSQEEETVPKLSTLKQQLVFSQKDNNNSDLEQGSLDNNIADIKREIEQFEDQVQAEVPQNKVDVMGNPDDDPLSLRMQAEDAGKAPKSPSHAAKTGCPSSLAYAGPSDPVTCLQVFNNHLYVCYQGKDIHRYHLVTGEMDMQYNCSYHSVQCMAVVAVPGKEDCIYAGGLSFHVLLFNVKTPHIVQTFELSEEIKCMHYDAGTLYVGLMSGSVEVFEVKNQRHKDSFQCAYQAIHCISSAREGGSKLICVSAQDTTISVCDARSGLPVRILGGHKKTSFSVMSSDHFVFSGSGDRTVMMHNLHTGKLEWTFKEHGGIVTSVWVEGNTLYSAGYDRLVRCFDIKSHTLRKMYYGAGKGVIMSIAVHGDELYTGSREGHVECIQMKAESWPCKIDSCQYVFGVREHLLHHLLTDHVLPNNKLARCMWKDCTDWLTQQKDDGSVEFHMRKHLDSLNGITA
ncbi:zinc finger protein 106-like isoform X1 [Haliotis cracherodii]|uniref:zinc finger protein 106-like isoform X1 n=1 Tax=Haliotis cracherodii TaxID=6455 RepID=UPI0039E78448